jgi:predicted dehydrogenase
MSQLHVALVGYGYWGPNLARNLRKHPGIELVAIVDGDEARLNKSAEDFPEAAQFSSLEAALEMEHRLFAPGLEMPGDKKGIDAVVIATPPETHFDLALQAMRAGKHVLLEKPMVLDVGQTQVLRTVALNEKRTLMVDHVYCYSAAARRIKQLIDDDVLGNLLYVNSTRINLGLFQEHCNVVWDLAVHDFSLLEYFFPGLVPEDVIAHGTKHYTDQHDTAHISIRYRDTEVQSHIHVSWLSPMKVRQMVIAGTKGSIVWDDMDPVSPVTVYDSAAVANVSASLPRKDLQMEYRRGDVWSPAVSNTETLYEVINEFVESIRDDRPPETGGLAGANVVKMTQAASDSLQTGLLQKF